MSLVMQHLCGEFISIKVHQILPLQIILFTILIGDLYFNTTVLQIPLSTMFFARTYLIQLPQSIDPSPDGDLHILVSENYTSWTLTTNIIYDTFQGKSHSVSIKHLLPNGRKLDKIMEVKFSAAFSLINISIEFEDGPDPSRIFWFSAWTSIFPMVLWKYENFANYQFLIEANISPAVWIKSIHFFCMKLLFDYWWNSIDI